MKARSLYKSLLLGLLLPTLVSAVTTLKDVRHFFPEDEEVPVAGQYALPQFYHGSDLYSRPVEGPIYSQFGLEFEIAPLFFLDRDGSGTDGRPLYYGFTTSFGFPLARTPRPNHYISVEFLGAFDSTDILVPRFEGDPNKVAVDTKSRMFSLLANYKYYMPPLMRERIDPYFTAGVGNSFKSVKVTANRSMLDGDDSSILTFQGGIGLRVRITNNFGLRSGYHLLFINNQDYGTYKINNGVYPVKEGSELLHALDLGMSLSF